MAATEIPDPENYPEIDIELVDSLDSSSVLGGQCQRFTPFKEAFTLIRADGLWVSCRHDRSEGGGPHMYRL